MKKILATSILFTLFVTASGCGHMYGSHKHDGGAASCGCEKAGAACSCEDHGTAKKDEKKSAPCAECAKGS
ncbi:hypothetical protein CIK05_09410 [Bdellovibrio sp. qaytius]|nr:hypothetical protein CIK05_09410 [Bdellovibrio sp. qaytius]